MWLRDKNFKKTVEEVWRWASQGDRNFSDKLKYCGERLAQWKQRKLWQCVEENQTVEEEN